jgi:integrase
LEAEVLFSPSFIERYIVSEAATLGAATRRTLRSNLRGIARGVALHPPPAPVRLSRERSKRPYESSEIEAYLALADAQPTLARRMRLSGLIALGAGAGLMGGDVRAVRGTDVVARSGGLVVEVKGARARVVPVRTAFHGRLQEAARFAGTSFVIGGFSAARRNVTSGLVASLAGGIDLSTIETGRLRATWLSASAQAIGLRSFMDAAGITCSQRLGDLVATFALASEPDVVALLGGAR